MKRCIIAMMFFVVLTALAAAAPLAQNEAYVLMNGLPLWLDDHGKLLPNPVESLTIGDKVTLLNRSATLKQNGQDKQFVRVKALDGKDGWARTPYIVPKASLAVIKTDKAVLYSEPREVKITSRYVSIMTLVAVLQDGSTSSFAKIQAYDRVQEALFSDAAYVSVDDLTTSDADVNAVILYAVAMDSPSVKKNLLKVAMTKYGDTIFLPAIQAAAGVAPAAAAAPVVDKETTPASGKYVINDDNVNVRATPDEKTGQVIGKLNTGAPVEVTEMTTETYTIGDSTAAWFHIKNPNGWVFGSFLEPGE